MGLREGAGRNQSERLPTTPVIEESVTFGRDADKNSIIDMLFSDYASGGRERSLIAIVGMGGVGKTTLAQLVYNDRRVKEHFNLQVWFCVGEEFIVSKLKKSIIEEVTFSTCNIDKPNLLQDDLKKNLTGKKFLLMLDDVWTEKLVHQEFVSELLRYGVNGSRVIITTRNDSKWRNQD
ncbi:putative disease resistance RPP13-like protein 1 [Morella rubra]|uniref:Putative disease resistance RPP13-like protein 1 n=1 Tax=Morella rubra TaxID=262757 RepID=A0A6A1VL66_9ROSI|nr:putative disease resistance RPP13-like protein 1 [Morella rubra]